MHSDAPKKFWTEASIGTVVGIARDKAAVIRTTLRGGKVIISPKDLYSSEIVRETLEVNGFGWGYADH